MIAERGRYRAMVDNELVTEIVELAGGDARADVRADKVQGFRRQLAGPPHAGKGAFAVQLDGTSAGAAGVLVDVDIGGGLGHFGLWPDDGQGAGHLNTLG